jgi:hypothetical protein
MSRNSFHLLRTRLWRNSLPSGDKNRPMKVFPQSHVELDAARFLKRRG